ncbi:MAG: GMC family oxidoreductase N-terminal domain-containing protein [Anaerolineae bacterium]
MVDYLIVGSGAGGAALARELSGKGRSILIVERGGRAEKLGKVLQSAHYFDGNAITLTPAKSREGTILWRALALGGSTVMACGNGVRCLERELADAGIPLADEMTEVERDLKITPTDERLLSEGSLSIRQAARDLGYRMDPMPKYVDAVTCMRCGRCSVGCASGAKWTSERHVAEAQEGGVELLLKTRVDEVLTANGKARGVRAVGPGGAVEIAANVVILAAGGLGTPVILQHSGIDEAGTNLFIDLLTNTYAVTDGPGMLREPQMALVNTEFHEQQGFMLSTYVNGERPTRLIEAGLDGARLASNRMLGMMTKIADESAGRVFPDGTVSKPVTDRDRERLRAGGAIAREILIQAGGRPKSVIVSAAQGAHPGGTAAVGRVVDAQLQTRIENLFVCDASVLPTAPGAPPIVTILALAKRLGRTLEP